jgi:uncharacterized protein YprB with RNaseH-like and TPR domain
MIKESFVLLPRVGRQSERNLWQQGIFDWNGFIDVKRIEGVSEKSKAAHDRLLKVARQQLMDGNSAFFEPLLPPSEQWRLYSSFRDEACFLDIETGMRDEVTVVGISMGDRTYTLLRGQTLDKQSLLRLLSRAKILVTFNGRSFDMPVLEKYFNLGLRIPHIDMMHACAGVGLKGGLKSIEKDVGIRRPDELAVIHGAQAPALWNAYHATGDEYYLNLLVKYNEEDCSNLQTLADKVIPQLWENVRNNPGAFLGR